MSAYQIAESFISNPRLFKNKTASTSLKSPLPLINNEKVDFAHLMDSINKQATYENNGVYDYENKVCLIQMPSTARSVKTYFDTPKIQHSRTSTRNSSRPIITKKELIAIKQDLIKSQSSSTLSPNKRLLKPVQNAKLHPRNENPQRPPSKNRQFTINVQSNEYMLTNPLLQSKQLQHQNSNQQPAVSRSTPKDLRNSTPVKNFIESLKTQLDLSPIKATSSAPQTDVREALSSRQRNTDRPYFTYDQKDPIVAVVKEKKSISFGKTYYMGSEKKQFKSLQTLKTIPTLKSLDSLQNGESLASISPDKKESAKAKKEKVTPISHRSTLFKIPSYDADMKLTDLLNMKKPQKSKTLTIDPQFLS